jgi:heat shock protein HslJ
MKTLLWFCPALAVIVVVSAGCHTAANKDVAHAAAATLLDTRWRLTQVGEVVVPNPAGTREVYVSLQSQNPNVTGFSGCNRLIGHYLLDGPHLKFDQLGGTKMFCDVRMELEQRFVAMFEYVASWEITGRTLRLLDSTGKTIAGFEVSTEITAP